ncbi:sialate O-acetylesterase [Flavobacteriaceae bacterium XHP0103]|uniref:sialate O-acetylesterase n=1 Tax=Marixanthotalea marina TaxID=2844359 RepID=UPI00298A0061|nr:sialate O-acetylesterase [Marixanthotalea marina]MBU3820565.1 sialate O-acetylesterase [Marixanthotalea marina]
MKNLFLAVLFVLPITLFAQKAKDTIRVFYLGGQSNMEGFGYNKDLPKELNKEFKDIFIFHGNSAVDGDTSGGLGYWDNLKPGHGIGFQTDGKNNQLSDRFGIELSFAKRMQELYPNDKIALIKYSRNGSGIDSLAAGSFGSWEADFNGKGGINQYDHYLTTIKNALKVKDINNDGKEDVLVPSGILWMQGESDGDKTEAIALRYYDNLKRLMDLMRASLLTDDLPVVIGKISDSFNDADGKVWDYGDLVQYAQEKFARTDGNAAIVRTTKFYNYSDKWHYDSAGFIDFGKQFAEELSKLTEK